MHYEESEMNVASRQMRLLDEIHRHGPKYVREARRALGDVVVDIVLRTNQVNRFRLPNGDVLTLGTRAQRALGLPPSYSKPSTRSLHQQITRGRVIEALEQKGWRLKHHRNNYLSAMVDPWGRRTLVAVNHTGYSSRTLRRLVSETLLGELLSGSDLLIVDPNADRLKGAARDHQHLFTLESLEGLIGKPPT